MSARTACFSSVVHTPCVVTYAVCWKHRCLCFTPFPVLSILLQMSRSCRGSHRGYIPVATHCGMAKACHGEVAAVPRRQHEDAARLQRGLPVPVRCCWNGAVAMDAAPFLAGVHIRSAHVMCMASLRSQALSATTRHDICQDVVQRSNVVFSRWSYLMIALIRSQRDSWSRAGNMPTQRTHSCNAVCTPLPRPHQAGECAASECSLLCNDLLRRGAARFLMDPGVRVAYTHREAADLWRSDRVGLQNSSWADVLASEPVEWDRLHRDQRPKVPNFRRTCSTSPLTAVPNPVLHFIGCARNIPQMPIFLSLRACRRSNAAGCRSAKTASISAETAAGKKLSQPSENMLPALTSANQSYLLCNEVLPDPAISTTFRSEEVRMRFSMRSRRWRVQANHPLSDVFRTRLWCAPVRVIPSPSLACAQRACGAWPAPWDEVCRRRPSSRRRGPSKRLRHPSASLPCPSASSLHLQHTVHSEVQFVVRA